MGFFVSVVMTIAAWLTLAMQPAEWDFADAALKTILSPMWRIVLGSMCAYLVSNLFDTWIYAVIREKAPKRLWLRNNGSTWCSQAIDSIIFASIALLGTMPLTAWLQVLLSTYILKVVIAVLDTPFLYIAAHSKTAIFDDQKEV